MALVAGGGIDKPLPAALLSQLLPPVRGIRIAAPYSSDDDERAPLIPTGTPASSTSASSDPAPTTSFSGATRTPASSTSASSDPAPTTSFPGATAAKRWRSFGRVGDVFGTWTKQRHDEPYADIDIEMAFPDAAFFPNPGSSMLKANSAPQRWANGHLGDSGARSMEPAASSTAAKRWRPFGREQGHDEPYADIDIEMASPYASFPYPAASSMLKANSAPARWANGLVGDGRAPRFQSTLGLNINSGAGSRQPAASSSVASASGQSAAESMVGAGTPSGSVMGAGSAFGSVVGTGNASGQTIDWMKKFKGLLLAYVFFALPIILFFFPRYDKSQSHPVLQNLMDNSKVDFEKVFILVLFVIHVTAGVLGVLLAHIAQGPMVTRAVGVFTLWIITSILGFMDYILMKTMPENLTTTLMFLSHFIITATIIFFLWFKYVWPSRCCQGGTRQD